MKSCYRDVLRIAIDMLIPLQSVNGLSDSEKSLLKVGLKYLAACDCEQFHKKHNSK